MSKSTRMRTLFNKTNRIYFNGINSHYFTPPMGVYCVYIDDIDESYEFDRKEIEDNYLWIFMETTKDFYENLYVNSNEYFYEVVFRDDIAAMYKNAKDRMKDQIPNSSKRKEAKGNFLMAQCGNSKINLELVNEVLKMIEGKYISIYTKKNEKLQPVYLVSENGCALIMPVNTGVACQYNLLKPSLIPIDK